MIITLGVKIMALYGEDTSVVDTVWIILGNLCLAFQQKIGITDVATLKATRIFMIFASG